MLENIIKALALKYHKSEVNTYDVVRSHYKVLLRLYPYADKEYLKRRALQTVEQIYKEGKK